MKLYRVRWKGYSAKDDTWEPIENISEGCFELIDAYYESVNAKKNRVSDREKDTQLSRELK